MKVFYATLKIAVLAETSEVFTNELALSDKLYELREKLERWLKHQGSPFDFDLMDMGTEE